MMELDNISLVVLAAGLGSRFGGSKQLAELSGLNKTIMELSILESFRAGVRKVVIVVSPQNQAEIERSVLPRLPRELEVCLALQEVSAVPEQWEHLATGRIKPWGTGHALLAAKSFVNGKAVVVNADDYYGRNTYGQLVKRLVDQNHWCMVGYPLGDTLSKTGGVNRGVCDIRDGFLHRVEELLDIESTGSSLKAVNAAGRPRSPLPSDLVSMSIWGIDETFFEQLGLGFEAFLSNYQLTSNAEFFLPDQIQSAIDTGKGKVEVLPAKDQWLGVTYKQDWPVVEQKLQKIYKKDNSDSYGFA